MPNFDLNQLVPILPEIFLIVSAVLLLMKGAFTKLKSVYLVNNLGVVILLLTIAVIFSVGGLNSHEYVLEGSFIVNRFTVFTKILVLIGAAFALFVASGFYRKNQQDAKFEYPVLVLLSVAGMMIMISAGSFITLYVGLELQSLCLYVLACFNRNSVKSSEAGLKYFVLGALSSGLLLYGCSLVYGFSGTISFEQLALTYGLDKQLPVGTLTGLVFIIAALCFKVSAVPFHMWTPDVYEGSPMPVTTLFAVAPKIAAIALIARVLLDPFGPSVDQWQQIIIFVSAASMLVGAFGAIMQKNIKRLLAYSSIGHVGYALMGVAAGSRSGVEGMLVYMAIYMTMTLGMFACVMMVKRRDQLNEDIEGLAGLSKQRPMLAAAISILMLSMAGIPPLAGFFGKFLIFLAAIEQGMYVLVIIGLLSSVVAAFYYLNIIKIMYFNEAGSTVDSESSFEMRFVASASATINLFLLVVLSPLIAEVERSAATLF